MSSRLKLVVGLGLLLLVAGVFLSIILKEPLSVTARILVLALVVLGVMVGLLIAYILRSNATKSVAKLVRSMQEVEQGDLTSRIEIREDDELHELGNAFNRMTARLSQSIILGDYLQRVLDSTRESVLVLSPTLHIRFVNIALCNLIGYTKEELVGTPSDHVFTPVKGNLQELFSVEKNGEADRSCILLQKGGEAIQAEISVAELRNGREFSGLVCVAHDVRQRLQRETRQVQAQKLESVSQMAASLAHDFNNLLSGVLGNISYVREVFSLDGALDECLAESEDAAMRATGLTNQLLTFAKGGAPVRKISVFRQVLETWVRFSARGAVLNVRFEYEETLHWVEVDTGQIAQAVQNVVLNAIQATGARNGCTLIVGARNQKVDGVVGRDELKGNFVVATFTDDCGGVAPENLEKLIDPYFSTKKGATGLGLTSAYAIVKAHGGTINLIREKSGLTVEFYLPASTKPLEKEPLTEVITGVKAGRILVMDDEEMLRTLMNRALASRGHTVVTTAQGHEAVKVYQKYWSEGEPFDVVILDLVVPLGMGGVETLSALKGINPDVRVIVCSGYSNDPVMAKYLKYGFSGMVQKPFRVPQLLDEVARLMALKPVA